MPPPIFVLVHGAWHGGWCWSRVLERLRARGYAAFAPTLTGLGERSHLFNGGIDLSTHVQDVVNVLRWEDLNGVVLCGHSYGGCVISGVVERTPERVAGLIFLDAFVPDDGQAALDIVPDAQRARMLADAGRNGGLALPPITAEHFGTNERDCAYVNAQCVPQPLGTFTEKIALTGARERVAAKAYVRASTYRSGVFDGYRDRLRGDPAWSVHDLPSGHDAMLDAPDALTEILLAEGLRATAG